MGLALGTNLKFEASVAIGLKLRLRMFWALIRTFAEVAEEKLVGEGGGAFCPHILNRVKSITTSNTSLSFNCKRIVLKFLAVFIRV